MTLRVLIGRRPVIARLCRGILSYPASVRTWILGVLVASAAQADPHVTLAGDPVFYAFSEYWDAGGSVRVSQQYAIGLWLSSWRSSDDPSYHQGHGIELGVPYYLDHCFEGTFVEPRLVMRTSDNKENTHDFEGPGVVVGVQHTWKFLTIAGAIGIALPLHSFGSSADMSLLDGYLHLGFAF